MFNILLLVLSTVVAFGSSQEPVVSYSYPVNHLVILDAKKLGLCMALINQKYGSLIKFDKDSISCEPFKSPFPNSSEWKNSPPKGPVDYERGLFSVYLAAKDRTCDFQTGKEEILKKWVLEQSDNSIDPLLIYEKSMEINNGNIWAALIAIHQMLRNNARWRYGGYKYQSSIEDQKKFFDKFIDIRGDLRELGNQNVGDHAGSWYRIWAAMLFRLNLSKSDLFSSPSFNADCNCYSGQVSEVRKIVGLITDHWASAVTGADGILNSFFGDEKDKRKSQLNSAGADVAAFMLNGWTNSEIFKKNQITEGLCRQKIYLQTMTK